MRNFQDTFVTRTKRSFISAFSICMTVPLNKIHYKNKNKMGKWNPLFVLPCTINRKIFQVSSKFEFLLIYVLQYQMNSSIANSNISVNFTWFPQFFHDREKDLQFLLIFLVSLCQQKSVATSFIYRWDERLPLQHSFNGYLPLRISWK